MLTRVATALRPLREARELLLICVSTVLVMAGQGVIAPVLPLFARSFGVGAAEVGLTLSAFAAARMVLNIPLGILSDRRGRRVLLVTGPLVTAVGMIGSGFAVGIGDLLIWRFVAGAGSAMYMTGAQVYLVDISTPANRARFIGTNQGALLLGVSVGPAVGGLVAEGFGFRAPFFVVGVAALFASLYAFVGLPETRHLVDSGDDEGAGGGDGATSAGRPWVRLLFSVDFLAVALVTMSIFFTRTAARQTLMPLLAADEFGFSPGGLGVLFTVLSVVTLLGLAPAALIADRLGRKWAIVPSGLVVAVALAFMASVDSTTWFVTSAVVMAAGNSIAGPAPAAYVADIAPASLRGLAMGMYRTSGDVGFVVGPPLLGAIADVTSIGTGLIANGVLVAVAAGVFLLFARETVHRRPRHAAPVP
jgi:MFS family permease